MKTFMQFTNRCLVLFLFAQTLMMGRSFGQCRTQAEIYNTYTQAIDYCPMAMCPTVTVDLDMGCTGLVVAPFRVEVLGGITLVSGPEPLQISDGVFRIELRAQEGSVCKGRVLFRYFTTTDHPCGDENGTNFPINNLRYFDVFKNLGNTELDAIYASSPSSEPLGSPFKIITESPKCISANDVFNLSVYPIFSGCLSDDIGFDEIHWNLASGFTVINKTADGSTITLRAPGDADLAATSTFEVQVGRASLGELPGSVFIKHASTELKRGIAAPYIVATGVPQGSDFAPGLFYPLAQGVNKQVVEACMPINRGGEGTATDHFTLAASPSGDVGSASYQWSIPLQFDLISGTVNSQAIRVRARNRTGDEQGASGVFYCQVRSTADECGNDVAFFHVNRSLVEGYNTITVSPLPGAGPSAANCFYPNESYRFTLEKAPGNTPLVWSNTTPSTTESYWEIVAQPSAFEITLRPVVINNDLSIPLSVRPLACDQVSIAYQVDGQDPQIAGSSVAGLEIRANNNEGQVRVQRNNGQNPPTFNWYPSLPEPNPCQSISQDFRFTWTFSGQHKLLITDPWTPVMANLSGYLFDGPNSPSPTVSGFFDGIFTVEIESKSSTSCGAARCFYARLQTEFDGQLRPSGSGDAVEEEATVTGIYSRSSKLRSISLVPNPATTEVAVSLPGLEPGGRLRILNSLQALVRSVPGFEGGKVSLKGLATGMYTVEYQSPTGEKAISRMSVQ